MYREMGHIPVSQKVLISCLKLLHFLLPLLHVVPGHTESPSGTGQKHPRQSFQAGSSRGSAACMHADLRSVLEVWEPAALEDACITSCSGQGAGSECECPIGWKLTSLRTGKPADGARPHDRHCSRPLALRGSSAAMSGAGGALAGRTGVCTTVLFCPCPTIQSSSEALPGLYPLM